MQVEAVQAGGQICPRICIHSDGIKTLPLQCWKRADIVNVWPRDCKVYLGNDSKQGVSPGKERPCFWAHAELPAWLPLPYLHIDSTQDRGSSRWTAILLCWLPRASSTADALGWHGRVVQGPRARCPPWEEHHTSCSHTSFWLWAICSITTGEEELFKWPLSPDFPLISEFNIQVLHFPLISFLWQEICEYPISESHFKKNEF